MHTPVGRGIRWRGVKKETQVWAVGVYRHRVFTGVYCVECGMCTRGVCKLCRPGKIRKNKPRKGS
jgi:hypothetical protein